MVLRLKKINKKKLNALNFALNNQMMLSFTIRLWKHKEAKKKNENLFFNDFI